MFCMMNLISKKSKTAYIFIYIVLKGMYIITPLLSMKFIDAAISGDLHKAAFWAVAAIVGLGMTQVTDYLFDLKEGKLTCEAWNNICDRIKDKLGNVDLAENPLNSTQLQQILGQEYEEVKNYIFKNPIRVIISIVNIVVIEIIIFSISWILFLVSIVLIPASLILSTGFNKKVEEASDENVEDIKEMKQYLDDALILSKEERTLKNKQLNSYERLKKKYETSYTQKNRKISFVNNIISYGSLNLIILITTLISGFQVYAQTITIGELYAIQIYVSQLWSPCEFLIQVKNELYEIKPMINDILRFLRLPESGRFGEKIQTLKLVDYRSLDKGGRVLNKPLNQELKQDCIYIIQGDNGIGKTTLLEAILGYTKRFLGNIQVNSIEKAGCMEDVVYIPANAYISKFYNEKMSNYSSGQKKKAQIELALNTEKAVYIFDEPTNFLDEETKKILIELILSKTQGKMVLIATHDLAVVQQIKQSGRQFEKIVLQAEK